MKAVVLQPMYLPWMGYFGMMDQADVFVFYDDVQFNKDSWQQRNRIKVPTESGETKWLKVPIIEDFGQNIESVQIDQSQEWRQTHLSTIKSAYGSDPVPYGSDSAPFFEDYIGLLESTYDKNWESLRDLNVHLIREIAEALGITSAKFQLSSDLDIAGSGTEKLINTLQQIGANEYISGPGAKDYLDVDMFVEKGISLFWHEFDHPEYSQLYGEFVSHLSVIDILFHMGEESSELIRKAEENALVPATE